MTSRLPDQTSEPTREATTGHSQTNFYAVIAAIAAISSVGIAIGISFPLISLLMEADGISSGIIGASVAIAGLAVIVVVPFVSRLSIRFGVVNMLVMSIVTSGLLLACFYFTDPLPYWFIIRFLFSASVSMAFILSEFWINEAAGEERRGIILGIYGTILSAGFALGPAILAWVGTQGFLPFAIGASIIIAGALPVLLARPHQPTMVADATKTSVWPYVFIVPLATGAAFTFGAAEQIQMALLPVYGVQNGYSTAQAALLISIVGAGHVAMQIPLGIWSDRVRDRRLILLFCTLIGILGSSLLPLVSGSFALLGVLLFLFGGTIGGLYTVGLAHLGSRLTGTDLVQANAAFVLCYGLGMAFGPQLTGFLMDFMGPEGLAVGFMVFFCAYIGLYITRSRNLTLKS